MDVPANRNRPTGANRPIAAYETGPTAFQMQKWGDARRWPSHLCHHHNMPDPGERPVVEHLAARGRFRLSISGREAVVLDYVERPGVWDIVHTYADPSFRGTGLAGELVTHVFDQARSAGRRIVPSCPYIPVWLTRHPEAADLVGAGG